MSDTTDSTEPEAGAANTVAHAAPPYGPNGTDAVRARAGAEGAGGALEEPAGTDGLGRPGEEAGTDRLGGPGGLGAVRARAGASGAEGAGGAGGALEEPAEMDRLGRPGEEAGTDGLGGPGGLGVVRARAGAGVSRVLPVLRGRGAAVAWAAVLAAALVLCGLSAWSYADTRGDGALAYGKARDAALSAGRRGVARLNTVDAVDTAHLDRDLAGWLAATTGPLHDQLTRTHGSDATALKAAGTSTRGTVTDAAVTELDTRAGTAKLIATVQVRLTPASGTATTDRKRFEADLSRTAGGWKVAALTAVPVGAS